MMRYYADRMMRPFEGFKPILLPPSLYDAAKAKGVDMRGYVRQEQIPVKPTNSDKLVLRLK